MTVTLSYGGVTVDISQSDIEYYRDPRIGKLPVGNRYGDVKQTFGTGSYEVTVRNGAWTGVDPRNTINVWEKNNSPVVLTLTTPDNNEDLNGRSFLIIQPRMKLVPGIPSTIMIYFQMDLTEAI